MLVSLDAHHLVYVGLRDVDPEESALMERMGVLSFGMQEVDRLGFQGVLAASLAYLRPSPTRPLHVSIDIDVLDPCEAPSTGTPGGETGRRAGREGGGRGSCAVGLTLRECLSLCEAVHATGHLGALDLVEVNPSLGTKEDAALTASAARLLLLGALAARRTA
ncbi:Arginase-1 [Chionoecetes opilio]|uniref:Arginase-1 n=1 Tax=Chionoecetes opilio TaxID=41210 RepID=A0A8J5CJT8_CHIOP|nr:Arginase-1 [Chionoecetes opilio]